MLGFMFGVLGSFIFWGTFLAVSVFIGTVLLKHLAPSTYNYITKGENNDGLVIADYIIVMIVLYFFWPIVLLFIIVGAFFKYIVWRNIVKIIKFTDSIVPEVKFSKKEEKENV